MTVLFPQIEQAKVWVHDPKSRANYSNAAVKYYDLFPHLSKFRAAVNQSSTAGIMSYFTQRAALFNALPRISPNSSSWKSHIWVLGIHNVQKNSDPAITIINCQDPSKAFACAVTFNDYDDPAAVIGHSGLTMLCFIFETIRVGQSAPEQRSKPVLVLFEGSLPMYRLCAGFVDLLKIDVLLIPTPKIKSLTSTRFDIIEEHSHTGCTAECSHHNPSRPLLDISEDEKIRLYQTCAHCYKSKDVTLSLCSQCRFAAYCSASCQRSDWSVHKGECRLFQESNAQIGSAE